MSEAENIVDVDDDSYEEVIDDGLVLLDFWAEWCGPCKALEPVLEELAAEHPALTVARIDADESDEAMDEFGVQSLPTMILFERGDPVEAFAGKVPYPKLERAVAEHA